MEKAYWFKRKRYGYGWTPVTWQGWLAVLAYVITILAVSFGMLRDVPDGQITSEVIIFFVVFAAYTSAFVVVASKNAPKAHWRWGKKPDDNPAEDW